MFLKLAYERGINAVLALFKIANILPPPSPMANNALAGLKKSLMAPKPLMAESMLTMDPAIQYAKVMAPQGMEGLRPAASDYLNWVLDQAPKGDLQQIGHLPPPSVEQSAMSAAPTMRPPRRQPQTA